MHEMDALTGLTVQQVNEALEDRVFPQCCSHGAHWRAARGVARILAKSWTPKVIAAARPIEIRMLVFTLAAQGRPRGEVVQEAAQTLGVPEAQVLEGLFADRATARRVVAPEHPPQPQQVVDQYNLVLVQSLLGRSTIVRARAREHVKSVVRFAKLHGLICECVVDEEGTRIELSGPLSLLHHTTKYGHALARFFPALIATPGWSLEASCILPRLRQEASKHDDDEPRPLQLRLAAGAPVACPHALPAEVDSAVERALLRDIRRLRRDWRVYRETAAIRSGNALFFPDFCLVRGTHRVLVEVMGYYTPSYLARKIQLLREARIHKLIVCVDASLACDDGEPRADVVLRYRRRVDAGALLDAADRIAQATRTAGEFSPGGTPLATT
jgi:hypothetical protein